MVRIWSDFQYFTHIEIQINMQSHTNTPQFFLLILSIFLSGCSKALYVPNNLNTPLFQKKEEFRFNVGMTANSPRANFDFQGAYAISDKFAVMANSSFMPNPTNSHHLIEGAFGVYSAFAPDQNGFHMGRFETFGGYGFGWASESENITELTGRYQRAFLQPAVGFRNEKFDVILATRVSAVNFTDYRRTLNGVVTDVEQFGFATIEPAAALVAKGKLINFYFQASSELLLSGREELEKVSNSAEGHFGAGISLEFPKKPIPPAPVIHLPPYPQPENRMENQPTIAPVVIPVSSPDATICFQAGDSPPDSDKFRVSFNGAIIAEEFQPGERPMCFEVNINPKTEGSLLIWVVDDGRRNPNTLLISVLAEGQEEWFYLRPEKGKGEKIRFRVEN